MPILRVDRQLQTAQGQAIAGAQVYVLTQPANVAALTPLATVYSDIFGTPGSNPQITDGLGQVGFYLDNTQLYTFVYMSPYILTQVFPDQTAGASVSAIAFQNVVPSGAINSINTIFTLPFSPSVLFLFKNGIWQIPTVDYTLSGNTITTTTPPQSSTDFPPNGDFLNAVISA